MWPYLWIAAMLGLVIATVVAAIREKKARTAALKNLAPQPLDAAECEGESAASEGFGEADPVDSFGTDAAPGVDFAALDEDVFK